MKASVILFFFILYSLSSDAQSEGSIEFVPTVNGSPLALDSYYPSPNGQDSFSVNKLRFYISHLSFYKNEHVVYQYDKNHLLLDASKPSSLSIIYEDVPKFTSIRFQLGVDSTTNASGAKGGDLDPMHGMYWTWNSGYINFKLEGNASNSTERKKRFRFHIGGYQNGFNAMRIIELPVVLTEKIKIDIPIDKFLNPILEAKTHTIMSPSARSMKGADMLAEVITIKE